MLLSDVIENIVVKIVLGMTLNSSIVYHVKLVHCCSGHDDCGQVLPSGVWMRMCPAGKAVSCRLCPAGCVLPERLCPAGKAVSCRLCPAGKAVSCRLCPAGKAVSCRLCPASCVLPERLCPAGCVLCPSGVVDVYHSNKIHLI